MALFDDVTVVIRGGGDLGTGVALRLHRAGFAVGVTERAAPLTIRRTVALSTAVADGSISVEGMTGRLVTSADGWRRCLSGGDVPVVVDEGIPRWADPRVIVDARLAKRPLDSSRGDGELVVGLGPGFVVGQHCDAVIETQRGHRLGRVLWAGSAAADTGQPGTVGGRGAERVVRAPSAGEVDWSVAIGDSVTAGATLGSVGGESVTAPFDGVVRGLISPAVIVSAGLKIGDVDPRGDPGACYEVSDKALAVGGGVVEAVLTWLGTVERRLST